MNQQEFLQLLDKYLDGKASEEEALLLFSFFESLQRSPEWDEATMGQQEAVKKRMLHQVRKTMKAHDRPRRLRRLRRTALLGAATVLLFLLGLLVRQGAKTERAPDTRVIAFVPEPWAAPPVKSVSLTLHGGATILLDTVQHRSGTKEGLWWQKKEEGLVFRQAGGKKPDSGFHVVSTPPGAQQRVVLPDGSTVWLNAGSALRVPLAFGLPHRRVQVSGEAYFEVKKQKNRPFRVYTWTGPESSGNVVEVLGTEFNVNAYPDEKGIRTTLVEGSVHVALLHSRQAGASKTLAPGEEAFLHFAKQTKTIDNYRTNVSAAIAWKQGLFDFNTADIRTIMRQVARWYDVEVVYAGKGAPRRFSGKISRSASLQTVLQILEQSNIRFAVQGRRITVFS